MDSKEKAPAIPEKLREAMEGLIRAANAEKFALVGIVLRADPPAVAMLRNTKDDPASFLREAADLVDRKTTIGAVVEERVLPLC